MNGFDWIDCQVMNNHLATLGAEPMDRYDFIELLREALEQPSISGSWAELAASNTVHLPSHLIPSIKSEE